MKLRSIENRKSLLIVTLAVLGFFVAWLTSTNDLVAQDEHDGHDHAEKAEDHKGHDAEGDHDDHGEEEGEHADHDEHDEHKDVVMLSDADMKKFGIEVATASAGDFRWILACPAKSPSMKITLPTSRRVFPVLCAK